MHNKMTDRTKISGMAGVARLVTGFALLLFVFVLTPVAMGASVPEWSVGFPRLAEKNALLQWNPVTGATEYKVYKTTQRDKDLKLVGTTKPNRYIDKDLPAGKTFYYYITAVVGGKESGRSVVGAISTAVEKVFVPLTKPTLEGGHVKTLPNGRPGIGIRWEGAKGTDLVGINVYRSTTKGKGYVLVGSPTTDTFEDTDVKPGTTYYYVVTAVDSNFKETSYSNEISVLVPAEKQAAKSKTEDVKPTKMRAAKLLFTIPRADDKDRSSREPVPENATNVVVDEAVGHIYVASAQYGGVLVFDMSGNFQFSFRKDGVSGDKKIPGLVGLALGNNGDIYATGSSDDMVYMFDYSGKPIDSFRVDLGYIPERKNSKATLYDIEVDREGTMYITDPLVNRVHVFNSRKKLMFDIKPDKVKKVEISAPSFITLENNGNIVFTDAGYSKMYVFSPEGKLKNTIGSKGFGAGYLHFPMGVATGKGGEIFNASGMSPNIQAFDSRGEFLYALANESFKGPLDVGQMKGIYIDGKDRLYVAEGLLNRVSVYQLTDKYSEVVPEK